MARNGSGTYSRVSGTPYVYNTTIDQVVVNAEMDDIATALTNSLAKDGQTTPTANLPMGGYKLTGLAAGSGAGESVRYEQFASPPAIGATTPDAGSFTTLRAASGADIASAATIDLTAATGNTVTITGTTATSAFTMADGQHMTLVAAGAWPLTYHATTNKLFGGQNITLAAGDRLSLFSTGGVVYGVVEFSVNYLSSSVAQASAVSLTSGADANITSISAPAGEWWAHGILGFIPTGTTSVTRFAGGVNTTSATVNGTTGNQRSISATVIGASGQRESVARIRLSLSAATTVYLTAGATFTVSTMGAFGTLYLERA